MPRTPGPSQIATLAMKKNSTEMYNAYVELDQRDTPDDVADDLMDDLAVYHVSVSQSGRGYLGLRLSFPAENLAQAITNAILIAEGATNATARLLEVMPESEFLAREGVAEADVVTVKEAAEILGKTRVRVNQMIDEGKFASAQLVAGRWTLSRREVQDRVGG